VYARNIVVMYQEKSISPYSEPGHSRPDIAIVGSGKALIFQEGKEIVGIAEIIKGKTLSRKDLDTAVDTAKEMGAGGLIWIRKENDALQSPIVKYLKDPEKTAMDGRLGLSNGDVLFIMAGPRNQTNELMGRFRLYIGEKYGLIDKDQFKFLWIVDFPLLEYSEEEKRYVARHHPFLPNKT